MEPRAMTRGRAFGPCDDANAKACGLDGPPSLAETAGASLKRLHEAHARVDRIEEAILGPVPTNAGDGNPKCGLVGLRATLAATAESLEALVSRLDRVLEQVGG